MKTREQLEERLAELKQQVEEWTSRFAQYSNLEQKVNDWKGRTIEMKIFEEMSTESFFIERAIKYLF